jgi:hypothetical protein
MTAVLAVAAIMAAASPAVRVSVSGFPIVCGQPRGTVQIVFPTPVRVAPSISPTHVRLNGAVPERVSVAGHTVTIVLSRPTGIMCDSIALGPLSIRFADGLRLGTARTAVVTHGTRHYAARISS